MAENDKSGRPVFNGKARLVKRATTVKSGGAENHEKADVAAKLAQRYSLPVLTAREREILQRIAAGRSNKEIAGLLNLAENTVKNHVHVILEKLGVQDRTQAVTKAIARGILHVG